MKTLILIASLIAVAVAGPTRMVAPGAAGSAPAPEYEPVAVGPADIDYTPIAVGPAIIETEPVAVGPAIVEPSPVSIVESPVSVESVFIDSGSPLVQIILNIHSSAPSAPAAPISPILPILPIGDAQIPIAPIAPIAPAPIEVNPAPIEVIPAPIEVLPVPVPEVLPEAGIIGTPVLPSPVGNIPEELN